MSRRGFRPPVLATSVSLYAVAPVPVYRYVYENPLGPSPGILVGAAKTF